MKNTNSFNCKYCGTKVSLNARVHACVGNGTLHGQRVPVTTIYTPNFPKRPSKQLLQLGYAKRFGSRAPKPVHLPKGVLWVAPQEVDNLR